MDVMRYLRAHLGVDDGEEVARPGLPAVGFFARIDDTGSLCVADVQVRVFASRGVAEQSAREWVESSQKYCAIAWTVGGDVKREYWRYHAEKFGPADSWALWGNNSYLLPGEEYVETWLRANTPPASWVDRVTTSIALENLTVERAVACADVLGMLVPHLGAIQPADLHQDGPPRGVPVWRLPPGEQPSGEAGAESADSRLERVRRIMNAAPYSPDDLPGRGVTIAVLDTGVNRSHPAFRHVSVRALDATGEGGEDRDLNGHGTWCCAAIGGRADDTTPDPYRGIASGCALVSVKVLTRAGWGTDAMIARGIEIAVSAGVDGISMSLGGAGEMPRTKAAILAARAAGIPITAAAGNEGPGEGTIGYPGGYTEVECVGALTQGEPPVAASFSSRGPQMDICAPGERVYGAYTGQGYAHLSGTSMATPLVAAARAVCRAVRLAYPTEVRCPTSVADMAVYDTARFLPEWGSRVTWYGQGVVDLYAAIELVKKACRPTPPPPPPPPPVDPPAVSWDFYQHGEDYGTEWDKLSEVMATVMAFCGDETHARLTVARVGGG